VSLSLAQRQAALVAIVLLAAAVTLAITSSDGTPASTLPTPVGSYTALAGSSGVVAFGRRTACGQVIGPRTQGVAHPVLPCGVKVYIDYAGWHVLTQVIDHSPLAAGRAFEVTAALALRLGLTGVRKIHWSYAGAR
jgi:hypothetical protein